MKKKLLSLFLTAVMLFGMVPVLSVAAAAAGANTYELVEYVTAERYSAFYTGLKMNTVQGMRAKLTTAELFDVTTNQYGSDNYFAGGVKSQYYSLLRIRHNGSSGKKVATTGYFAAAVNGTASGSTGVKQPSVDTATVGVDTPFTVESYIDVANMKLGITVTPEGGNAATSSQQLDAINPGATDAYQLILGNRSNSPDDNVGWNGNIYYAAFYDTPDMDEAPLAYYVPARNSSGTYGMLDLVRNWFDVSATSTTWAKDHFTGGEPTGDTVTVSGDNLTFNVATAQGMTFAKEGAVSGDTVNLVDDVVTDDPSATFTANGVTYNTGSYGIATGEYTLIEYIHNEQRTYFETGLTPYQVSGIRAKLTTDIYNTNTTPTAALKTTFRSIRSPATRSPATVFCSASRAPTAPRG